MLTTGLHVNGGRKGFGGVQTVVKQGFQSTLIIHVACNVMLVIGRWQVAGVRVMPGSSGWLLLTTREYFAKQAREGRVSCPTCGMFVSRSTGGMAWHMKNSHGTESHADAHIAALAGS